MKRDSFLANVDHQSRRVAALTAWPCWAFGIFRKIWQWLKEAAEMSGGPAAGNRNRGTYNPRS
jgi:hypothetical protein